MLKIEWQYEADQVPVPQWKPDTGSRPPVKHVEELIGLGQIGYIKGDPGQARRDRHRLSPSMPISSREMRALVDRFDLDQYMATLKTLHSYDH